MNKTCKHIILLLILLVSSQNVQGQNLDKIGKKGQIKVSGGVSFNTVTYFESGLIVPQRDPFTWFASGNINVSILDVALPFSYSYSNQQGKFTQPFNRASLHPKWKWINSHIGLVTMNFSPYTLSGHLFLGGGVELTPGKWKIKVMGGRLQKEVDYDAIEDNLNDITYRRLGYGIQVGYEGKNYGGELSIFKGQDDPNSLNIVPLNSTVKPQDNLVLSLKGKAKLVKSLSIEAEYAMSALTQNVNDITELHPNSSTFLHNIIRGNATTDYFNAFNASVNHNLKKFNWGLKFEHIDPGYKTLGGYYFNQDLQNYTLTTAFTLLKKKMNVSTNTGFQRNNLSTNEAATTNRWIGSINTSYAPNSKWLFAGSYSNFSTFTRNRPLTDPFYFQGADTLNFFQLMQNASFITSYSIGEGDVKSVIQLLYNFQESTNLSGAISNGGAFGVGLVTSEVGVPMKIHLGNLGYTAQFKRIDAGLTLGANVNQTFMNELNSTFFGPSLNFQKAIFKKKGSLLIGSTYNRQYSNSDLTSNILSHRMSLGWKGKFKNEKAGAFGVSANVNLMQRFALSVNQTNIHEMNIFVNLNYNF